MYKPWQEQEQIRLLLTLNRHIWHLNPLWMVRNKIQTQLILFCSFYVVQCLTRKSHTNVFIYLSQFVKEIKIFVVICCYFIIIHFILFFTNGLVVWLWIVGNKNTVPVSNLCTNIYLECAVKILRSISQYFSWI